MDELESVKKKRRLHRHERRIRALEKALKPFADYWETGEYVTEEDWKRAAAAYAPVRNKDVKPQ